VVRVGTSKGKPHDCSTSGALATGSPIEEEEELYLAPQLSMSGAISPNPHMPSWNA
jgi:hypothetical protein